MASRSFGDVQSVNHGVSGKLRFVQRAGPRETFSPKRRRHVRLEADRQPVGKGSDLRLQLEVAGFGEFTLMRLRDAISGVPNAPG